MEETAPILPAHIEETIRAIAKFQADHQQNASYLQRVIDRLTAEISRPPFLALVSALIAVWVGINWAAASFGYRTFDEPPFIWLQNVINLLAFYVAVFILATQRWQDQLGGYRDQLTLELAILSEQKTAKIIELLEELRRDHPNIRNRVDHEANAMAQPADPQAVLDAIKDSMTEEEPLPESPPPA